MSELVQTRASVLNRAPGTEVFRTYTLNKCRGINRRLSVDIPRSFCFWTSQHPERPCFPERHTSQGRGTNGQCQTGRKTQVSALKVRRKNIEFLGKSQNKVGFLSYSKPHTLFLLSLYSVESDAVDTLRIRKFTGEPQEIHSVWNTLSLSLSIAASG